jgi:hypothetical protein
MIVVQIVEVNREYSAIQPLFQRGNQIFEALDGRI